MIQLFHFRLLMIFLTTSDKVARCFVLNRFKSQLHYNYSWKNVVAEAPAVNTTDIKAI